MAATTLLMRAERMFSRQQKWREYWQDLADILLPEKADFVDRQEPGEERNTEIYDSTPRQALRGLASTIDGLMKGKSTKWFGVTVDDDQISDDDAAKRWFETVERRMWKAFYNPKAGFIHRSGQVDTNLSCFGWGVLWAQENRDRNGLLFRSFHIGNAAFEEDGDGLIDAISVRENFTAEQAAGIYRRLGKEPSKPVREALEAKNKTMSSERFPFVQIILPQHDHEAASIAKRDFDYASAVIDVKAEQTITEMGFHEFPAAIPRWETSPGEIYPRSPGMMALPDARTLQAMGKTLLIAGERAADPPTWVLNDSVLSPVRTHPGGVTVLDAQSESVQRGQPIGVLDTSGNIPIGREMQDDYRRMVEAAFFKNVFSLPIEGRQMTATEILERKEEFIRTIGPVFGRLESDYLGRTVERVFAIMERAGAFPDRPEILQGREIEFRFRSPIEQAQKQLEIASLSRTLEAVAPLAQAQPEMLDNLNGDEIIRDAPEFAGLPFKYLRDKEQVDQLRQSRAEGQQMQDTLAGAGQVSEAFLNVARAQSEVPAE